MNTTDVVAEISKRMKCYQKDARELLEHFAAVVAEKAAQGEKVKLSFLGTFYPAAARGRKRKDGTHRRVLRFKPARRLAERVSGKEVAGGGDGEDGAGTG
uniref:HU family DNA-binding protein n=1 Tax=Ammonifex degensii TaxID=42838 RepID=A0A7C2IZQ2_9THEO